MNVHSPQLPSDEAASQQFASEIEAVRRQLSESVTSLGSPFHELVQARIQAAGSPFRAALVLCAGYNGVQGEPHHRIHLAAALEMLNVALGIHQLLVESAKSPSVVQLIGDQRSFIGSTILAGDFCFSRAAQMAAMTENPAIVSIFAQALQDVSENQLRECLSDRDGAMSTQHDGASDKILLRSGAAAALELSNLPLADRPAIEKLTRIAIEAALAESAPVSAWAAALEADTLESLPVDHTLRWQALRQWLASPKS